MINDKKASEGQTQEPSTFAERMFNLEFRGETDEAIKLNLCKVFLREAIQLDDCELNRCLATLTFDRKEKSINLHFKIKRGEEK